jgi:hypothetical protein
VVECKRCQGGQRQLSWRQPSDDRGPVVLLNHKLDRNRGFKQPWNRRPRPGQCNYVFDAFGPYPIAGAAFAAGINQFSNAPPEWNQGVEGYSKRFGSDFGIAAVGTTTRYGLAEASRKIRCTTAANAEAYFRGCAMPVLLHLDGAPRRRRPSRLLFPALVAPYAGSMTAVYGWYPNRFGAKDAFRMGNYSLLAYMGGEHCPGVFL